jgi:hypothetical protein
MKMKDLWAHRDAFCALAPETTSGRLKNCPILQPLHSALTSKKQIYGFPLCCIGCIGKTKIFETFARSVFSILLYLHQYFCLMFHYLNNFDHQIFADP